MVEKLQLLESVLGKGIKSNRDYYQFMCPFHVGKHGPKLGISMGTGGWKCWVCPSKGRSVSELFSKLKVDSNRILRAKNLFKEQVQFQQTESPTNLSLPKEFIPLWENSSSLFYNKAKNYILSRGLSEGDILKHRLGYCEHGKYSDMIIMPCYNNSGQLTFFTGRTFNDQTNYRFSIPIGIEKDIIYDENLINWSDPVILVESKLDAIVIKRNAIPLMGKQIPGKLRVRIIEEQCPVILCLDGDALKDALRMSDYFIQNGITVSRVILPENEDPASLGHVKIWEFIENAERISETDIFEFKILEKLR